MNARVRDRQKDIVRTVTAKAYSILPHRYELLGWENEDGTPADGPPLAVDGPRSVTEKKRSAAPVAGSSVYKQPVKDAPEQAEAPAVSKVTREDLDRMNQEAMAKAQAQIEAQKPKTEEATVEVTTTTNTLASKKKSTPKKK